MWVYLVLIDSPFNLTYKHYECRVDWYFNWLFIKLIEIIILIAKGLWK